MDETEKQNGRRDDRVGGEKRELEGNGGIYMMTSGRAVAIFPAVPATLSVSYRPPDIFPFPFSPAVSTCTILAFNRDLFPLPSPPLCSLHFALVALVI
jgi:hypothetical protein